MKCGAWWLSLFAGALLSGCASTDAAPKHVQITDEVNTEATVVGVNKSSRDITLQRPDGETLVVMAGPEVRNFDQIKAGDKVKAKYAVSLSARLLAPGEADTRTTVGMAAGRAKQGDLPAGAIGAGLAITVKVKSVDAMQHIVTFTTPDGTLHVIQAERDEGKRFVEGLKAGDRVELVYKEAAALSVS
jgi:hypothetical protein